MNIPDEQIDSFIENLKIYIETTPSGLHQASVLRGNFRMLYPRFNEYVSDTDMGYILKWMGLPKKRCSKGVVYIVPEGFTANESKLAALKRRLLKKPTLKMELTPDPPHTSVSNPSQADASVTEPYS